MPTATELIAQGKFMLRQGMHPERAMPDAESLLLHVVQMHDPARNKAWLIRESEAELPLQAQVKFLQLVARRVAGEPMQYVLGKTEFFGLPFSVGPGVLIPRPETEHLVEEVIRLARAMDDVPLRIADIGTGSGIIAVAVAHTLPTAEVDAVDLSPEALRIAEENARRNFVEVQIRFHQGDLFAPLAGERFPIIASNLPYIPLGDEASLAVEVREHEPHAALFAGDDGLAVYRRLIPEARRHLEPGGWLVMEIGFGQADAVEALLDAHGFAHVHFVEDYQKIPRVAAGQA